MTLVPRFFTPAAKVKHNNCAGWFGAVCPVWLLSQLLSAVGCHENGFGTVLSGSWVSAAMDWVLADCNSEEKKTV